MDITNLIVQGREKALLYGDYSTYHAQLTKRLHNARKKLGITTKNRGKFQKTDPISPENIAQNHEYGIPGALIGDRVRVLIHFLDMSVSCFSRANELGPKP